MPTLFRSTFVVAALGLFAATALAQSSAPATPVITSYDTTSRTPSFHGTADPGVTIERDFDSNLTTTARADGTWDMVWSQAPLDAGDYTFFFKAINAAGVSSNYEATAEVKVAPDGPPVVKQLPDDDVTWHFYRHDEGISYEIFTTNEATSLNVTGLPPGYSVIQEAAHEWVIHHTYSDLTGGKFPVTVTATNSFGPSAPMTFNVIVHPGMNEFVSTDKSHYNAGDTITFTTRWSAPVVVTGTPYIKLWGTKKAVYSGGSGTAKLTFTYQLQPDDAADSGYYFSAITDPDGTITTTDGVSASLVDSYQGLGDYPTFSIAAPGAPIVSSASIDGVVGEPITPVQLQATNSPTSFQSDTWINSYGLQVSTSGLITGTPTKVMDHLSFWVYATNSVGQSAPTAIAVNITATSTPPPSPSKSNQTITFSSPVSAVIVGQPIQLGATSSAGLPITYSIVSGDATLNGATLTPTSTANLIVRASSAGNDTTNPASVDVSFGTPQKAAQSISLATTGGTVPAEKPITLSGTASSGLPVTYTIQSGPATISGNTLTFTGTGTIVVRASQTGNGSYAAASDSTLTFTANPVDRLVNISSRVRVGPDAGHTTIAGFVVTGDAPKAMLIRAVGPTLSAFGITDGVAAPELQLRDSTGKAVASNSGWNNDAQIAATGDAVGAFHLPSGSNDAAILATLAPGLYTAQVTSASPGTVLIEVYDGTANAAVPTKQLINISTRGAVGADDVLIGGFVVNGATPKRILIRAVGPGLSAFGVSGVLSDPMIKVYNGAGAVIAQNDNWETGDSGTGLQAPATAAQIAAAGSSAGAFGLQAGAKDAAVILTVAPGAYSAVVTAADGGAGAALVEIYEVPTQ